MLKIWSLRLGGAALILAGMATIERGLKKIKETT